MEKMKHAVFIALAILLVGCGRNPMLSDIQKITADHLKKSPSEMNPKSTFAALGADDLDVVEITMAVEDKMGITIQDSDLAKAAGTSPDETVAGRLTLAAFAQVAAVAPKGQRARPSGPTGPDDGTLRESQVGLYGELSKRPNPNGYVLVFVPSFDVLAKGMEQKMGRSMTDAETAELKTKAACIALPPAMAAEMKRKQEERSQRK